jgi:hypothetical protein
MDNPKDKFEVRPPKVGTVIGWMTFLALNF